MNNKCGVPDIACHQYHLKELKNELIVIQHPHGQQQHHPVHLLVLNLSMVGQGQVVMDP